MGTHQLSRARETDKQTENLHHSLLPLKSNPPVSSPTLQQTPCQPCLSPAPMSYGSLLTSLLQLHPSPQLQQAQTTHARKPGRMPADSLFSLCPTDPIPQSCPQLCNITCCSLPLPTSPMDHKDLPLPTSLSPLAALSQAPKLQPALSVNTQPTPAKKAGRLSVNLPLSFCTSRSNPQSHPQSHSRPSVLTMLHHLPQSQGDKMSTYLLNTLPSSLLWTHSDL